ncbi:hypothetical protein HID58_052919 [Brassica napus]|uniref:Citrate transporter-like domain-containing protein n=3 Tax=Brassica TaxID=3705 RepID=A0ABQ8AD78_BRANA|nr:hypothetical protein HID58_052919 [Brassica napus]
MPLFLSCGRNNNRLHNSISTSPQVLFKSIDKQIRDTILAKKARKNFTTLMQTIWIHGGKKRPEKLLTKSSSSAVTPPSRTVLLCLFTPSVGFVTFFLSSILDNLSSTIVMVSLLRKLVPQSEYRKLLGAVVVMAANAGGAWTPIGDVTTTMLWIHGLGVLWVLTDAIHYGESERQKLKIPQALSFTSIE